MAASVKDIAKYLGINLRHLSAPLTVAEVDEMARYLEIDLLGTGSPPDLDALLLPLGADRGGGDADWGVGVLIRGWGC